MIGGAKNSVMRSNVVQISVNLLWEREASDGTKKNIHSLNSLMIGKSGS